MRGVGVREVVALAVLALALGIGYLFLDPASSESGNAAPGTIHLGEAVTPTQVPTPAPPTATPEAPPARVQPPAGGWFIQFVELPKSGGELASGQGFNKDLDFTFPAAPFFDFKDDAWLLRATATFEVPEGRAALTVEHDCDLRVFIDDREVLHSEDGPQAKAAVVTFTHAAGTATVRIEGRDVSGPFRLRFVP